MEREKNFRGKRSFLIVLLTLCALLGAASRAGAQQQETQASAENNIQPDTAAQTGTPETTVLNGLVFRNGNYYYYQNGKCVKSKWKKIGGQKYYFRKNGKAAIGPCKIKKTWYLFNAGGKLSTGKGVHIVKVGDNRYFAGKNGKPLSGWRIYKKELYYSYDAGGKFLILCKGKRNGVTFDKNGAAKKSLDRSIMYRATVIMNSIATDNMSRSEKLRRAWNYIVGRRFRYIGHYPNMGNRSWPRQQALDFFNMGGGNCYGFACAFASLAAQIGYDPVIVYGLCSGSRDRRMDGLTRHCCLKIDGRYYDPEAQYAGWSPGIYGTRWSAMRVIQGNKKF